MTRVRDRENCGIQTPSYTTTPATFVAVMAAAATFSRPKVGVGVFVRSPSHPDCILLGKRRNIYGDGTNALPGGHLEGGESWADCAAREVLEETGLVVTNLCHGTVINAVDAATNYHYVVIFMIADAAPGAEPENLEPSKCEGWSWHRWGTPLPTPVFRTLADCLATGFDPLVDVDAGRLLHSPDDTPPPYCCCILHERSSGRLFVEQRSADAAVAAGKLTCFGGKREPDEAPTACIERELREELGPRWAQGGSRKRARAEADEEIDAPVPSLRRAVDLYVDGALIAWFYEAAAPEADAELHFEAGRSGVWLQSSWFDATPPPAAKLEQVSPWHLCVLRAWRRGERRADYITPKPL